jgi:hypothetical protein
MRTSLIHLFLPLLLLCCAPSVKADPISVIITGGSASTPPELGNFSVNLTGTAFRHGVEWCRRVGS